jgi:D-psicose/D-tagatose/L-ribulose 3-epimerase
MRYSVSNWIFGHEPIERGFARLARQGYDAIELRGEPDLYPIAEINRLKEKYGLAVSSICGMYPGPRPNELRDLSHPRPEERQRALDYVFACLDFAAALGAPVLILTPNPVAKTRPLAKVEDEWKWAVESVRRAGERAAQAGLLIAVEPINRYETYLINSCDRALQFIREVNLPSVKMMLDTFHVNIEEPSPVASFRRAGPNLVHVHVADSNRQPVGRGHLDFKEIIRALVEIQYNGALAMEPLPPVSDPYLAISGEIPEALLDQSTRECVELLRRYEVAVQ